MTPCPNGSAEHRAIPPGPAARAKERTDRFVATAIELMEEYGKIDFTVQDVVDRSKMSIRTFYNFFKQG